MPDDFDLDPAPEVWARLRAYLALSTSSNGEPWREPPVPYPPASERQLRETEAVLGFPLPQEL